MRKSISMAACGIAGLLLALATGASAHAGTILSFEDGTTQGISAPPPGQASETPHVLTNITGAGATDGTHALQIGYIAAYQQGSGIQYNSANSAEEAAFIGNTTIQIDLTRANANANDYLRFDVALNYRNVSAGYPYVVGYNATSGASPASIVFGGGENGTKTLSFNYADYYGANGVPDATAANFYLKLVLITNSSGAGNVTIDNVRFVTLPEPATLTVAAAGLAVLGRRRRAL